jgi:hypothetical protein
MYRFMDLSSRRFETTLAQEVRLQIDHLSRRLRFSSSARHADLDDRIVVPRQAEVPSSSGVDLLRVKRLPRRNLARSCDMRRRQQDSPRTVIDPVVSPYLSTGSLCKKIPPP